MGGEKEKYTRLSVPEFLAAAHVTLGGGRVAETFLIREWGLGDLPLLNLTSARAHTHAGVFTAIVVSTKTQGLRKKRIIK